LSQALQQIGVEMYGAQGAAPGGQAPGPDNGDAGQGGPDDEDVVEGEFSEAS
jgi:hypothetical protein